MEIDTSGNDVLLFTQAQNMIIDTPTAGARYFDVRSSNVSKFLVSPTLTTSANPISITNTNASTSTTSGALIVGNGTSGGLGVGGALNVGSTASINSNLTIGSDSTNGHLLSRGLVPTVSSGSIQSYSTDVAGKCSILAGPTTQTITFNSAYTGALGVAVVITSTSISQLYVSASTTTNFTVNNDNIVAVDYFYHVIALY